MTKEQMNVPRESREFAINMANYRYWSRLTRVFFDQVLHASERFKCSSVRWNAAMVGDVHRILSRGGIFLYPEDMRPGNERGKLRLLYEANPLSLLIEKAGGKATSAGQRTLEIMPNDLHQRVPVVLGSVEPVDDFNTAVFCT